MTFIAFGAGSTGWQLLRPRQCELTILPLLPKFARRVFRGEVELHLCDGDLMWTGLEYAGLLADGVSLWFIVYSMVYDYHAPGRNWYALHPAIGCLRGWESAESGLFKWGEV